MIWKLCKHFGFEMSLYLIDEYVEVCPVRAELMLDVSLTDGTLAHNLSGEDWQRNKWDVILGKKIIDYYGCDRGEGSVVRDVHDNIAYVGMRIRCNSSRE